MKVLVATEKPFAENAKEAIKKIIEDAGYEFYLLENYKSKENLKAALEGTAALIVRSDIIDEEIIKDAKDLKLIVRAGAGYDNINIESAGKHGICVMNTPGQNSNGVAELTLGFMIYASRNFYNGKSGNELKGKTLGIQAYGHIGSKVAYLAKSFRMNVYAYDPFCPKEVIEKDEINYISDLRELYSKCQYVSLHLPANKETKNSIGYDLLKLMPTNAILINTARKEIIDESGLIKIMKERRDFKYITDTAPESKVFGEFKDRFFATPKKIGAQTAEANSNAGIAAARQIVDFFVNGNTEFKVN